MGRVRPVAWPGLTVEADPSPALPSRRVVGASAEQRKALRELLGLRTAPEWQRKVQSLDRELVERRRPGLTSEEYEALLAPLIRLRLRRALMHALEDDAISSPAAAQILGYLGRARKDAYLEDLLDGRLFPNLASPDFAFLREIKERLHRDVRQLRSAVTPPSS
jgi:hypothetical protein